MIERCCSRPSSVHDSTRATVSSSPTLAPRVFASSRTASIRKTSSRNRGEGPEGRPRRRGAIGGVLRRTCASGLARGIEPILRWKRRRVGLGPKASGENAEWTQCRPSPSPAASRPSLPSKTVLPVDHDFCSSTGSSARHKAVPMIASRIREGRAVDDAPARALGHGCSAVGAEAIDQISATSGRRRQAAHGITPTTGQYHRAWRPQFPRVGASSAGGCRPWTA